MKGSIGRTSLCSRDDVSGKGAEAGSRLYRSTVEIHGSNDWPFNELHVAHGSVMIEQTVAFGLLNPNNS